MAALVTCSDLVIDETTGAGSFTVRLLGSYSGSVVVNYSLYGGVASEGSNINYDFSALDGSLTFTGGVSSQTVNFNIFNDTRLESFEAFYLRFSGVTNGTLAKDTIAAIIVDNDTPADTTNKANLSIRDVLVDEKSGTATFDLVLDRATSGNFTVNYSTATNPGSATAGSDFTAASGTASFVAGQTVQHVVVTISDDAAEEGSEYFQLTLSDLAGSAAGQVQIADGLAMAVIGRNDQTAAALPVVLVSDIVVSEADGYAEFTVSLSAPSSGTTTVNYSLYGGQASEYTNSSYDFNGADGTLNFTNGVTAQTIRFEINESTTVEAMESLYLSLSSVTNGVLARTSAVGTIVDNDTIGDATNKANLSVRDVVIDEKAGLATFDLILDRATSSNFSVSYSTATNAGTATADADFTATSGSVIFAAGQTVQHVTVAIADDAVEEGAEFFNLSLGTLSGAAADAGQVRIADGVATAVIGRNDQTAVATPVIHASDIVISEADGYAEFTVWLSAPSSATTTVRYSLYGGLTEEYNNANYDFNGPDGTLTFAGGVTTQTVRFEVNESTTLETLESLYLNLSSPTNGVLARTTVVGTIVDNDTVADTSSKASLSVRDVFVDEKAGVATFDLILDRATGSNFSVAYSTATHPGTATAAADFTAASGTVTFAAGQTVQHVTVSIGDDALEEGNEFFNLTLGDLSGAAVDAGLVQIADGVGTAIIGRNDQTNSALPVIYASDIIVGEAEGYAEFVVSLSAPSTTTTTVNYSLYGGQAEDYAGANYDFNGPDGTLVFASGVTTQKVRFEINENTAPETLQSLYLGLSSATNGVLARTTVAGTIVDNDTVADASNKANLSVRDVVIDEKAGIATFDLILDRATSGNFAVSYSTATNAGTATADLDFTATSGSLTFAAGQMVQHVVVAINDDALDEGAEFFNLTLGALSGAAAEAGQVQIADGVAMGLIGRNDQTAVTTPVVYASDIVVSEADGYAEFVVSLSAPSSSTTTVNYSLYGGLADEYNNANYDFNGADGTLVFASGVTTQKVRFEINENTAPETLESLYLDLSSVTNGVLARTTATGTIVDNDTVADATNKANLSVRDVFVDEKAGVASFDLILDRATGSNFSVSYSTATNAGTATADIDFAAAVGSVSFAAGQTVQHVTVAISDDAQEEGIESFNLTLGALSGAAVDAGQVQIADGRATAFIGRNDQSPVTAPVVNVSDIVIGEADGYAEFVLTLSAPSSGTTTVNYSLYGGLAGEYDNASYDFNGADGTLVFASGVTTQKLRFEINENSTPETLESLYLTLSGVTNGVLARNSAVGTIVDNDTVADATNKANLSVRDVVIDEKAGTATFDLVLDRATSGNFAVDYSTATHPGTAIADVDFTATSGSVTFAAGQTVQHVTVTINDDTLEEGAEFFNLTLGTLSGAAADAGQIQIADGVATAFIGRNDQTAVTTPVVYASDIMVSEAEGYAEFVVTLSAPSSGTTTVNYYLSAGSASEYSSLNYDFNGADGTLNFTNGMTTQKVRFEINGDTVEEALESLSLQFTSITGGTLSREAVSATIVDNDRIADASNKVNLSVRDVVVDEKAGIAIFDVIADRVASDSYSVAYATASGTATAGDDYSAASGMLTFAVGETVKHVTVNLVDDLAVELEEGFWLNLGAVSGNAANVVQVADGSAQAIIGRSDQTALVTPSITVNDPVVGEGDGYVDFVVRLSAPGTSSIKVTCNTSTTGGTAAYGDFTALSSFDLVFEPGVTTQTVRVPIINDALVESAESFSLVLSSPTNAVLGKTTGVATIVDNDTAADTGNKANLTVRDVVVSENAGTATVAVLLDKAASDSFSVAYATSNGSAVSVSDYVSANGTLIFAPGETAKSVTVFIQDDAQVELDELLNFSLGTISGNAASQVQIGDPSATIGINNDDADLISPYVTAFSPADEATGVAVGSNIVVTFSETVQRGTGNIVLKSGTGAVVATYAAATSSNLSIADNILTINPSADLATGTAYTVEFAAGSIKDLSGNGYAGTNGYNFSTYAAPQSIPGSAGNDRLSGGYGDDNISGQSGTDTAVYLQRQAAYSVGGNSSTRTVGGPEGNDTLTGVERLGFSDSYQAFDTDGNAGQMYRLYKAAFARTPDLLGLGNWIANLDNGATTLEQAAAAFASSQEFQNLYGSNTSNEQFISLLYLNALGRKADAVGLQNYVNALSAGSLTRAKVLAEFSESQENKNSVQKLTGNGILYATGDQAVNQNLNLSGGAGVDNLYGSVGKDSLTGAGGDDFLNGGADIDTAIYSGARSAYTVTRTATGLTVSGGTEGTDTLVSVERLKFSDGTQAFDIDGNAGQVYRLYQAAFDRSPDIGGMSNYLRAMDNGMTLSRIATDLMGSAEFTNKYGASPSSEAFVTLLYENALNRAPDDVGKTAWLTELELGMTRENALIGFAESAENQAAVVGVIQDGIALI